MSQETERYQLENNGNTYLARASASGGGADVEANPEGTATTDLEKLKVGETIYGIPVGYEINTYQQNKTYTSADSDYQQLLDDISNKRVIQIGSSILSCQDVTTSTNTLYTYITTGTGSTVITSTRYLITYNSTNNTIEIASPTVIRMDKVVANPTLAGTESALTGLQVGDTKYAVESGMTNPMTTAGDIIYAGANGTPTRLASGNPATGYFQYLGMSSSNVPSWAYMNVASIMSGSGTKFAVPYAQSSTPTQTMATGTIGNQVPLFYSTTAPTANNNDGLKIVVLSSEPATRYNGYLYIITA